ncbi:hypothetical protein [Brevundimonas diminuta]|uniref:Tip attachment protein J domain-containing protein n=5 Tax=Brevundimonas diminuta TaxID=293 RepID=A0A410NUC8_BREDI|nr:hypothetical protein [Brevundimonas diminuta]QAT13356.1 hypothetical protein EQG53_02720 [Brevundimonas diminuta]QQB89282.1 hypothetical protein I6H83_02230 [Brevundimonas diminuta]
MPEPISATVAFVTAAYSSAVAATATVLGAMGTVGALGMGGTYALAGAIVKGGVMLGLSAASAALLRPNTPSSGTTLDFKPDPKAPIRGAMGYTALGGNKVFQATWGYKRVAMSLGVALSLGPIDQVPRFEADGATVTFSGPQNEATGFYAADMWQRTTLGLPGDAALLPPTGLKYGNPGLTGWGTQHAAPQTAFSFWTMVLAKNPEDRDVFTNGVPDPRWIGRWMKLWDPRKDSTYPGGSGPQRRDDWRTWEWSESPYVHALAWCRGHYKLNLDGTIDRTKRIAGIGAPDAAIDIPAFVEGMNVAQANNWTISGEWSTSDGKFQTLLAMLQAGGGEPISRGAQISVVVNAPRVATYSYTRDDLIGQAEIRPLTPRRERKNTIVPRYKSEANGWQYVPAGEVTSSVYRDEDRGEPRSLEIEYTHVRNAKQAGQLAAYDLANLREGLTATLPSKVHLMHVHPGDCITVDVPELALAGQKFVVRRATVNHQAASVTLELRSESDGKHAWALGQAAQPAPSPSLSAVDPKYVPPPAPEDWTVVPKPPGGGGISQPIVIIELPIETTDIVAVIIKHGPSAAGPWTDGYEGSPRPDGRYEVAGLTPGQTYCFSLQFMAKNGAKSEPDSKCGIVAGDLTAGNVIPTAPTIVSIRNDIEAAFGDIFDVSELLADARTQLDAQGAEIAAARAGEANLSARIAGVNQARIDGDEANALAISGVAARTANTEADIIDLENALANETTARAEAVQQVTARQRAAPNLLPPIRAWPFFGGAWVDDNYPTLGDYTFSTAPGSFRYFDVAIEAGAPFVVSIEGASGNGSRVQVEYHGASGYIADSGIDLRAFTWGQRVEATFAAPVGLGITKARVLLQNFTTASWARAMLQPGSISTSYREDAAVSSLGATVTEQSLAIVDLENQQAIATWRIKSEASGSKPAIIEAVSALGGAYVAFGAEQIYFGGNTVFDDATDTWQTVEGSTVYVRADGAPFGANANLREWWGPVGIALGAMTTANGYSGRMTTAPYNFDNTSGVGFHVKSSHMYISASRTGPGSVGTANVTVEAVGAVGPVDFIVYRMSGDASIEAFPVRSTASTAPYRHILSFDTNLTNQTKRAVFGCSARDAAGNTGNVVIEVEIFYNEE